jgi:hypothetical protein
VVCADHVNKQSENMTTVNTKIEVLLNISKEISLEVNAEKTNFCFHITRMQHKIIIYLFIYLHHGTGYSLKN